MRTGTQCNILDNVSGRLMFVKQETKNNTLLVGLSGPWTVKNIASLEPVLDRIRPMENGKVVIYCNEIESIDLSGAWLLLKKSGELKRAGHQTRFVGFKDAHFQYLKNVISIRDADPPSPAEPYAIVKQLDTLGQCAIAQVEGANRILSFLGQVFSAIAYWVVHPTRVRLASIAHHVHQTGTKSVPIVCLIAFLISIVISYQGAEQLRRFGATIYTIDLVSISVLREMGVLLTAIVVAGRSGSAFASQIGVMRINEEIDAMRIIGIDPVEALVAPRILALVITLPLLTCLADFMGLAGGAVLSVSLLDVSFTQYLTRVRSAVSGATFFVGLAKAPVFAFLIGFIGVLRGMQAPGSAEKVGEQTTIAVVQSIFLVIMADAVFSILFARLGV